MRIAIIGFVCAAIACAQQSLVVKEVAPEWGFDLAQPHVVEPVWVEFVVENGGEPLAMVAETGIPEVLVKALRQYRFAKRGGRYITGLTIEVHRPLKGYHTRPLTSRPTGQAYRDAEKLDLAQALAMEAKLEDKPESAAARTTLIYWAAKNPGPEANAMRIRQVEWLTAQAPTSEVLNASYSRVNASTDPDAYARIRSQWLRNLQTSEGALAYRAAVLHLAIADAESADGLLRQMESRRYAATIMRAELLVSSGLGVTAIDPATGTKVVTGDALPQTGFAVRARNALETSTDPRLLRKAIETLGREALSMGAAGTAPRGFAEICGAVLRQAKAALPDLEANCYVPEKGWKPDVVGAKILEQLRPDYPRDARRMGLEGRVVYMAVIGADGKTREMELAMGAFILHDASKGRLALWKYSPTLVDGEAVEVFSELEVNFGL